MDNGLKDLKEMEEVTFVSICVVLSTILMLTLTLIHFTL